MLPEASLVTKEYVIRDLQVSGSTRMTKKSLVRWFALSLGLISPGETRPGMLGVLEALFHYQFSRRRDPDIHEIVEYAQRENKGANEKAIRYHLLTLKQAGIVERSQGAYHFAIPRMSEKGDVAALFEQNYRGCVEQALVKIIATVKLIKEMYSSER
jgi:hypothetical protein